MSARRRKADLMVELVHLDLGQRAYAPTLALQRRLVGEVMSAERERAFVTLVEHVPPVITLGRGARREHVLASRRRLEEEGVELVESPRGGDVTYHGPGQLVAYPIIRLDLHGRDVHGYLRDLEAVVIALLGRLGIDAHRRQGLTGVWAGDGKIAAVGVAVRRWVTYHGLALNVSPNMSHFDLIVPCGLRDQSVTSMAALGRSDVSISQLKSILVGCLCEVFGFASAREGAAEAYG